MSKNLYSRRCGCHLCRETVVISQNNLVSGQQPMLREELRRAEKVLQYVGAGWWTCESNCSVSTKAKQQVPTDAPRDAMRCEYRQGSWGQRDYLPEAYGVRLSDSSETAMTEDRATIKHIGTMRDFANFITNKPFVRSLITHVALVLEALRALDPGFLGRSVSNQPITEA